MLDKLQRHLRPGMGLSIGFWENWINDNLKTRMRVIMRKFYNTYGTPGRASNLLRHIAGSIDTAYLSTCKDDFEAYGNYFRQFTSSSSRIFTQAQSGRAYRNMFFKRKGYATTEYVLPVLDVDHISILPLGSSWDTWKEMKPLTYWYHDSDELCLNILNDVVEFEYNQPTYGVVFLDSTMLGMMFYKYINSPEVWANEHTDYLTGLKMLREDDSITGAEYDYRLKKEQMPLTPFLHNYVFYKCAQDLVDIWVLNYIRELIDYVDRTDRTHTGDLKVSPSSGRYGISKPHTELSSKMIERIREIKKGNLYPSQFMNAPLFQGGRSMVDKIRYSFKYLDVLHVSQYEYARMIRDLPYVEIMLKLNFWNKKTSRCREFIIDLRSILGRYITIKPWNSMYDGVIKNHTKDTIEQMYQMCLGYLQGR